MTVTNTNVIIITRLLLLNQLHECWEIVKDTEREKGGERGRQGQREGQKETKGQ